MAEPGVLITRPEPGAAETAQRVAALGWRPLLAPALVLASRPFTMPPAAQALLLPSRAAARSLVPDAFRAGMPVLAVGEATAAEVRSRGFVNVVAADGDAASLARLAAATLDPAAGPLLLAVGAGYGQELARALRVLGFRVTRRIAYAAKPAATLPEAARLALDQGEVVAALFFSPRSASCAISLLRTAGLAATATSMVALAISARVAEAAVQTLAPLTWRAVRSAERPDQDSLLQLLGPR
ncbi:uroporphyrinogen-III synthase [Siccirubricoccus deserti]|uniref:Uroporphyrinogen-III synthase n=1 Tax=Siccirubricoccus deserti TaxID=2013562 RepID=A0A9X0R0W9_9PROT|nr:uroporphyrinogen-III synthase [Siccirubricoccus deserti]MBC4017624.1 uroporphyrinogen-III synthase [Siccirubricoccus deserti]